MKPHELLAIPVRKITEVIKSLYHLDQDSVLRDSNEALYTFTWDVVWCELESKVFSCTNHFFLELPKY